MIGKIGDAFAQWGPNDLQPPPTPDVDYEWPSSVNLVRKPGLNQSNIYLGHIGGVMSVPDYFALTVMNQILGQLKQLNNQALNNKNNETTTI